MEVSAHKTRNLEEDTNHEKRTPYTQQEKDDG